VGVCVVANHPLAGRYLTGLLERKADVEVVTDMKDLASHHALQGASPVLVIDAYALPMPLAPYLRAARLALRNPRILVTGNLLSDDELCRLLFLGVSGFVVYDKIPDQLSAAIDTLLGGHLWVPPRVLEHYVALSSALGSRKRCDYGTLSPRESEIVGLLQRRLCNKEIGSALGIGERTVRFHLQNVFDKLGVRDRGSVAELARSTGLVGPGRPEPGRPTGERQPTGSRNLLAAA